MPVKCLSALMGEVLPSTSPRASCKLAIHESNLVQSLVFVDPAPERYPPMRSPTLKALGWSVAGWVAACLLFILIRFVGLDTVPQFEGFDTARIHLSRLFVEGLLLGGVVGTLFHLLDRLLDQPAIRRRPYGAIILIQTAGNVGLMVVAQAAIIGIRWLLEPGLAGRESFTGRLWSTNAAVMLVYVTLVSSLFAFLKQVNRKFGPGNLWKLLIGMYHHPREEQRIFMFLDLKGSTTHAERLGHAAFSRLIQDCFIDLSVVVDHAAQVYQYVGDEVILYWEIDDGLDQARCLRAYFQFVDRLASRGAHYQGAYGVVPVFKAGLNMGPATVLEVGEIKREISYLGDVLNTAARIQGQCNEVGKDLLVPDNLLQRLEPLPDDLMAERVGEVALRGRDEKVTIHAVHRRGNPNARSESRGRREDPPRGASI